MRRARLQKPACSTRGRLCGRRGRRAPGSRGSSARPGRPLVAEAGTGQPPAAPRWLGRPGPAPPPDGPGGASPDWRAGHFCLRSGQLGAPGRPRVLEVVSRGLRRGPLRHLPTAAAVRTQPAGSARRGGTGGVSCPRTSERSLRSVRFCALQIRDESRSCDVFASKNSCSTAPPSRRPQPHLASDHLKCGH